MDQPACSRQLGICRGNFWHVAYRIEQKLGRAFRELKPYGLFPLADYFAHRSPDAGPVVAFPAHPEPRTRGPLRAPLKAAHTAPDAEPVVPLKRAA